MNIGSKIARQDVSKVVTPVASSPSGLVVPGKNYLLNASMRMISRSMQPLFNNIDTDTSIGYKRLDKWFLNKVGKLAPVLPSIQDIPGFGAATYAVLTAVNTEGPAVCQRIEDGFLFAGKTMTVSFLARASKDNVPINITIGRNFVNPSELPMQSKQVELMSQWAWYKATFDVDAVSSQNYEPNNGVSYFEIGIEVPNTQVGDFICFTNTKAEYGADSTPFIPRTKQEDEFTCARYFQAFRYPALDSSHAINIADVGIGNTFMQISIPAIPKMISYANHLAKVTLNNPSVAIVYSDMTRSNSTVNSGYTPKFDVRGSNLALSIGCNAVTATKHPVYAFWMGTGATDGSYAWVDLDF